MNPIYNPSLAPGFFNPASGGKTTLQVRLNPYLLPRPLCRLFESDMHAGSRRKGDKHFEAKSFPFASDQV